MAVIPIYTYDHPVLRKKTEPVTEITEEIRTLIDTMFDTMYGGEGIGLAGNQVGISRSICVIDIYDPESKKSKSGRIAMINPVIEYFSDEEVEIEEGCLSLPGFREYVYRPELVQVRYMDENMNEKTMEAGDLLSRVIQHELDHLNGVYFFERLSPLRRSLSQKKLRRIKNGEAKADYPTIGGEQK